MLRFRKILLSKYLYYFLLLVSFCYVGISLCFPPVSRYEEGIHRVQAQIEKIQYDGNQVTLYVFGKERLQLQYYFDTEVEKNNFQKMYRLGDRIEFTGEWNKPRNSTVPGSFDYKKDLLSKGIHYLVKVEKIQKVSKNHNLLLMFKQRLILLFQNRKLVSYDQTFILGDSSKLEQKVKESFQTNGISHLFAISGMHISFLGGGLLKIMERFGIKEKPRYIMVISFLFFFLFLTGGSASVQRATIFFFLSAINRIYYFHIEPIHLFLVTLTIVLLRNPFLVYQVGFQFSFTITFFLLLYQKVLTSSSKVKSLVQVSLLSTLVSLPISIFHFYQINFLGVLYNLFYVPFVSMILFPLVLVSAFLPFLEPLAYLGVLFLENSSLFLASIDLGILTFAKPSLFFILLYYSCIVLFAKFSCHRKRFVLFLTLVLFLQWVQPFISIDTYFMMLDVGQGDSIFLKSGQKTMLIDTGGKMSYDFADWQRKEHTSSIAKSKLLPYFSSLGIHHLNFLVLTHGDQDHLGEALELIENIKIDRVILNDGEKNRNEQKLIARLEQRGIPYEIALEGATYQVGAFFLQSLNRDLKEENDSSIVFLGTVFDKTFLLTGDASMKTEKSILSAYKLPSVDILKLGHHGSKTSTSEELLTALQPSIALISAGRENKFGHPNQEVLDRLQKYEVPYFLTAREGSIQINFSKGGTIQCFTP